MAQVVSLAPQSTRVETPWRVVLDPAWRWESRQEGPVTVHWVGAAPVAELLAVWLRDPHRPDRQQVEALIEGQAGHFALIVEGPSALFACVDLVRSYPLFYTTSGERLVISNAASQLKALQSCPEVNRVAALEFLMAGYVTGRETVYEGLCQLQPGELLWQARHEPPASRRRYYRHYAQQHQVRTEPEWLEQLAEVTDRVFRRLIASVRGAPIWVALSGGLDSRLIAWKLQQLGYDRTTAFSYGPRGNQEARLARDVARRLGLRWVVVPSSHRQTRSFFRSSLRKRFWAFADGLCSVPNMQDIEALLALRARGELPADAVIVNGQTGDFITGGHLPEVLCRPGGTVHALLDAIIEKHLALWPSQLTGEARQVLEEKILRLLDEVESDEPQAEHLPALYQYWEWQERQSKYVVNGQRVYDFLELGWRLPLWDGELVRFWAQVPPAYLGGQRLYRRYLATCDPDGVFQGASPHVQRWPGPSRAVLPLARLAGLAFGARAKTAVYKLAGYGGHYGYQYAGYSLPYFLRHTWQARSPVSFYARTWLNEHGLDSDS